MHPARVVGIAVSGTALAVLLAGPALGLVGEAPAAPELTIASDEVVVPVPVTAVPLATPQTVPASPVSAPAASVPGLEATSAVVPEPVPDSPPSVAAPSVEATPPLPAQGEVGTAIEEGPVVDSSNTLIVPTPEPGRTPSLPSDCVLDQHGPTTCPVEP